MTNVIRMPRCFVVCIIALLALAGIVPQVHAQSFEKLAVGASHICTLDASGQVDCTATLISTRFLPPDDLPLMREISAGQQHTCGITLEDQVVCWGADAFGVLDVPEFDVPVESLSAGFNHNCAIDGNQQVQCWGLNTNGQLDVPTAVGGFVKVDASRNATCGIDTVGDVHCWSTDSFFNTDNPIAGPFVDIDIDANQACGITANGDIECWAARERLNLSPPTNGPYSDLTVTNSAICGLRTDQLLDCSFAFPENFNLDTRSEDYPVDVQFSSIERSNIQFGGVPICGLRADSGTVSCFGDSGFSGGLPQPPGTDTIVSSLTADNISLGLTAAIYGRNQVELFWNRVPSVLPPISVEVYRDDELLIETRNSFSFYDNDQSVTSESSRYRVRTVDEAGNVGDFSNSIVVDRVNFDVTNADGSSGLENPHPDRQLQIRNVSVTAFSRFVDNNDSFVLTWDIDNIADTPIAGYEIRIDNKVVAFVGSTTFIGAGAGRDVCRVYSVAAIGGDGTILDYGSVAFGRNAILCPSER